MKSAARKKRKIKIRSAKSNRKSLKKNKKVSKLLNRGTKKRLTRLLSVFSLFFLSALFLGVFSFYKYLNQSLASAFTGETFPRSDLNVYAVSYIVVRDFKEDPVKLVSLEYRIFDENNKKVLIYDIPLNEKFDAPGKFGEEELFKVFALGALNSENPLESGVSIVNQVLFKIFGFKVNKYVLIEKSQRQLFDELWIEGNYLELLKLQNISTFEGSLKTNFNIKELYGVYSFIKSLPEDRFIRQQLIPGSQESIDVEVQDITYDSIVAEEKLSISILNGTDRSGLATFGARIVRNLGGRVVAIDNSKEAYNKSYIVADDPESATVDVLSWVFGIQNILSKPEAYRVDENEVDRSDIVVIIGFDISDEL